MNRILDELPVIMSGDYSSNPPLWFRYFFKFLFALGGIGFVILVISDWQGIEIGFLLMISVMASLFLFFAFHPRWGLTEAPYFLANHLGMYFKANSHKPGASFRLGWQPREVWLFVPWNNISNIRVGRIVKGEFSKGLIMDAKVSSNEVAEFLWSYGIPSDSKQFNDGRTSVVFYESSSQKMVAKLLNLMPGSGITSHSNGTPNGAH
jgi:hypothetical protein